MIHIRILQKGNRFYPQYRRMLFWKHFLISGGPEIFSFSSISETKTFLMEWFKGRDFVVQQFTVL